MTTADTEQERPRIKYTCWNPISRRHEEVFPESEILESELVIPLFWCNSAKTYVSVPGTEFYGPVPATGIRPARIRHAT